MRKIGSRSRRRRGNSKAKTGEQSPNPSKPPPRPYEVRKRPRATAGLTTLQASDPSTHDLLYEKLKSLGVENPYPLLHKIGHASYRVKQGDWRAMILVNDDERIVMVTDVLRRNEATYR